MKKLMLLFIAILLLGCNEYEEIEFEYKTYSKVSQTGITPEAEILFSFPLIINKSQNESSSKINRFIVDLIKSGEAEKSPNYSIEQIQNKFIKEFSDFKSEFPDSPQSWNITKKISVNYNKNDMVGFTFDSYYYLGGAHPNTFIHFFYFSTKTGNQIKLTDIIKEDKLPELNKLAEIKFRNQNNFDEKSNYEENGFFIKNGEFQLNENFRITNRGIEFLFNNYEVAAYAVGRTKIYFSFEELKNFLTKTSFFNY